MFSFGQASDICVDQKYCFLKERGHLEELVICGIILKWILKRRGETMSTGFVGMRTGARGGALTNAFREKRDNS